PAQHDPARVGRGDDRPHRGPDRPGDLGEPLRPRLLPHPQDDEVRHMSLATLLPGFAVAAAVLLALQGYRLLRSDAAEGLALEDLTVLRPEQRRAARGEAPLGRMATRLAP